MDKETNLTTLVQKSQECICPYYKNCGMKQNFVRDCTKPAYESCETYIFWESNIPLGVGALVLPGRNDLDLGGSLQ